MKDDQTFIWLTLAGLALGVAPLGFGAGGGPLASLLLCGLGLICAVHRPSRDFVMERAGKAFSGSTLRVMLVVVGAMMIWQLVGVELALLMAGDVLAYVEVLTTVSLIAANTRLAPLRAGVARRLDNLRVRLVAIRSSASRAARAFRRSGAGARSSKGDDGRGAGGWALA